MIRVRSAGNGVVRADDVDLNVEQNQISRCAERFTTTFPAWFGDGWWR